MDKDTLLASRYRILDSLAAGGMAEIYLAFDERLREKRVVKVVDTSSPGHEAARAGLEREASLLSSLSHPALPVSYGLTVEEGRAWLMLEYFDGITLEQMKTRWARSIPAKRLIPYMLELLDVLTYLHGLDPPVLHRDIKPENIVITRRGALRLLDFGIARTGEPGGGTIPLLDGFGTEGDAPPEQRHGGGGTDRRSDIYGVGALIYYLMEDALPSPGAAAFTHTPESLRPIISRCLSLEPAGRYQNGAELAAALVEWQRAEDYSGMWPGYLAFREYVDHRKKTGYPGCEYAVSGDERYTKLLFQPLVKGSVESYIEAALPYHIAPMLSSGILVGERQFPHIHRSAVHCSSVLGIPVPRIVIYPEAQWNACVIGIDASFWIFMTSSLASEAGEGELNCIIGHECGHIHNRHVTASTLAHWILSGLSIIPFLPFIGALSEQAVMAWNRAGEMTSDRAGLLCCGDLDVASRSLLRLACGSKELAETVNLDEFLIQHEKVKDMPNISEALSYETHPALPGRIKALRLFAGSELYYRLAGRASPLSALSKDTLEEQTRKLLDLN